MKNMKIGIFDSGLGGLEVLREIVKELPDYSYVYLGDTARFPYGSRSPNLVYKFTDQAVKFLFNQECQLIVLACNTASSEALRKIQQKYLLKRSDKKVLGVIIPAVEEAVEFTKNNRIGIMATEGTVASGSFGREIKKLKPSIGVFQNACHLLVPIIEAGEEDSIIAKLAIKHCIQPLLKKGIDTLILGCTHYGLLEKGIKNEIGEGINIISEGRVVAKKLKNYLERHSEINDLLAKNHEIKFFTTDLTDKFEILGSKFFGKKITCQKVENLVEKQDL